MKVRTWLLNHTAPEARNESISIVRAIPFKIAQVIYIAEQNHSSSEHHPGVGFVSSCFTIANRVTEWCEQNCEGRFKMVRYRYFMAFELESDAIKFKLVWG